MPYTWKKKMHSKFCLEKLMGREYLGRVEIKGRVIMAWAFWNVIINNSTTTFGGPLRNTV